MRRPVGGISMSSRLSPSDSEGPGFVSPAALKGMRMTAPARRARRFHEIHITISTKRFK